MRDMLVLCYWLDNSKKERLEAALTDCRKVPREKVHLLKELEMEAEEGKKICLPPR